MRGEWTVICYEFVLCLLITHLSCWLLPICHRRSAVHLVALARRDYHQAMSCELIKYVTSDIGKVPQRPLIQWCWVSLRLVAVVKKCALANVLDVTACSYWLKLFDRGTEFQLATREMYDILAELSWLCTHQHGYDWCMASCDCCVSIRLGSCYVVMQFSVTGMICAFMITIW